MSVYNWLCILGVPALVGAVWAYVRTQIKKTMAETQALKLGVQALLRDRLLIVYKQCRDKGFATISERSNFENLYTQYHTLGSNGVMDDIRNKFLALPTKEED